MLEEVGSSEINSSGKVGLSETVVLVLLAVELGAISEGALRSCHQGGFSVVAITACAITACAIEAEVRVLESRPKGESTSLRVRNSVHGRCGRQSSHGARGSASVGASRAGVSSRVTPSKVRYRFVPCLAGRSGQSVRSAWQYDAVVWSG